MFDNRTMALGPNQMPPQGAKAFISGLLGGGRQDGVEVSAVLDESENPPRVEFLSEGPGTAVSLQYVWEPPASELEAHAVGDLAPGATFVAHLGADLDPQQPFRFVWWCRDSKGRVRAWNYDGHNKRLRGANAATAEAAFRSMYR
jgi:hypothetical protein